MLPSLQMLLTLYLQFMSFVPILLLTISSSKSSNLHGPKTGGFAVKIQKTIQLVTGQHPI